MGILRRVSLLALAGLMVFASLAVAAKPGTGGGGTTGGKYYALGDSYSTGTMTGGSSLGGCGKSTNAYPYLLAQKDGLSLSFVACDGAETSDVVSQANNITSDAAWVSVTVGGNDVGFGDLVLACTTFGCQAQIDETNRQIAEELPAKLDKAYAAIKARSGAKVAVLGYARFFGSKTCTLGVTADEQTKLNGVADNLDSAIKSAAGRAGFTFRSSISSFNNHDVCATDPWLSNSTWHPTKNGHSKGLLPLADAVIG